MNDTMEAQRILDDVPMTRLQIAAVILCIALNALDGFDVLAISFAAPGIAAEWGISRGALGIVLAMELIGMTAGSVVLGNIADNLGRRPIILGCLVVMASGMYLASQATSVNALLATRFVTGVGIGGMLATTNAMVAEYSNARHRNFNVVLMATGYPVGIIIGGSLAAILLAHFDWRAVFVLGAVMTGTLLPAVWFLMPESISYLAQKKRPDALAQINGILTRMGHAVLEQLPASEENNTGWRDLFSPQLARTTILLTTAYLAHIITFYFILKWIPNIVVDMEYSAASAGGILVWANVGGAVGSILLGGLTHYFRLRSLIITALVGSIVMINVFGMGQVNLTGLAIVAGITGFFTNSAVVGLYAMLAQSYPSHLRAGGTGFVIGMGRAGAVLGPIIAGFLFEEEFSLTVVSFVMALGSLVAIFALMFLKEKAATN